MFFKLLKKILIVFISTFVLYLMFSFVTLEMNPLMWDSLTRELFCVLICLASLILWVFITLFKQL